MFGNPIMFRKNKMTWRNLQRVMVDVLVSLSETVAHAATRLPPVVLALPQAAALFLTFLSFFGLQRKLKVWTDDAKDAEKHASWIAALGHDSTGGCLSNHVDLSTG